MNGDGLGNGDAPQPGAATEASLGGEIDRLCDAFEAAWRQGPPPRLEDFLCDLPQAAIGRAFRELLDVDLAYLRKSGHPPPAEELIQRFPQRAAEIQAALERAGYHTDETRIAQEPRTDVLPARPLPIDEAPTRMAPTPDQPTSDGRAADATQIWTGEPQKPASSTVGAASPTGRFRVLRAFAKGGLGEVLVAEDGELHREVALKQIQSHHADDLESRARFIMEAEITGRLEHPGIVPVYGLGAYADGRPYYAMRFIQGDSLKQAIEQFHKRRHSGATAREQSLDFRKLLGRFVDVCDAIEYAHSRGIIHRDLKPANVMLGPYGETLVVDWGLAKAVDRPDCLARSTHESSLRPRSLGESAPTQMGIVVGTPQYMSPEQASGRTDRVGPLADVYGLGAILYCLLTGRPPISGEAIDLQQILDRVELGQIPPPRQVDPSVPKSLDAVCRKAMAVRPEDRYASARALAGDIEHYLADEAITARPDTAPQKIARWVRRHRAWATAMAVALLLISIVSTIAVVLVDQQRRIADNLANENGRLAQQEAKAKNEANLSFRQARDAVDDLFTDVSEDALLNQPGMQPLRKELLQKTLQYYEQFLAQRADDPSIRLEFGATLYRAARNIDELESESAGKALGYLDRAVAIQQQLLDEAPGDRQRLKALGDTQNERGRALQLSGKWQEAGDAYRKAVALRQQAVDLAPDDKESQRALANSVMNIGLVEKQLKNYDGAARQLRTAQEIRRKQLADGQEHVKLERDLAMGYYNQGIIEALQSQSAAADQSFGESVKIFRRLVKREPHDLYLQYLLSTAERLAAGTKMSNQQPDEAIRLYEAARDRLAELALRNPDVSEYQKSLADVLLNLSRQQESPAALSGLERAERILRELVEKNPKNPLFRRDLAETLRVLSGAEQRANLPDIARKNLREAIDLATSLLHESPDNKEYSAVLSRCRKDWREAYGEPAGTRTL